MAKTTASKAKALKEQLTRKDPVSDSIFFTTGCTLLDINLGGGLGMGFKAGTLTNIVAIEAAGKTQLAAESIAHNVHKVPTFWHRFIDREHRFSFNTDSMWGVTVKRKEDPIPDTIEELDGLIGNLIDDASAPGMIVVDSLDAFSTEETEKRADQRMEQVEAGKDIKQDGSYTVKTGTPAFLSESLRIRMAQASEKNVLLLYLSQVRAKLGAMQFDPNKFQRNGGKALDHWCDTVLWLKPLHYLSVGKVEDQTQRDIGVVVKAWTTKASNPRPYRECLYTILFDYGIDNIGSNIDYLFNLRDPKQGKLDNEAAKKIKWDGGEDKTINNVKAWLERHKIDDVDALTVYQDHLKKEVGSKAFRLDLLDDWLSVELKQEFDTHFACESYAREELIAKIEADKDLETELENRVKAKWEIIEAMAATNRRSKFG